MKLRQLFKRLPLAVVFIWAAAMIIIPLVYVIVMSFTGHNAAGETVATVKNYTKIFDQTYLRIFRRSLMIALSTTVLTLLVGYPFGYFLARVKKKYKTFFLLAVMIPFWTNSLLRLSGWMILLQRKGVINNVLMSLRIIKEPLRLMNNDISVLIVTVYILLPFMILPIFNAVDKMDKSVLEASADLGAGKIKTFFRVTLPMTVSGIAGGCTLVFIPAVGLYFISDRIGDGKVLLLGELIQSQFVKSTRNWEFGAALSVIMIAGILVFVFIALKTSGDKEGGLINI